MSNSANFKISIIHKDNSNCANKKLENCINYQLNVGEYRINAEYSGKTISASNEDFIILLVGNIYQDDLLYKQSLQSYLIESYTKYGIEFIKKLNGSFCMFVADNRAGIVHFATDRLNSRKIFYAQIGEKLIFTTKFTNMPLDECKISYGGIASYLINGVPYNNLTVFEEIKLIDRSSLITVNNFKNVKIQSRKYWDYTFSNEFENFNKRELADVLIDIYKKSLQKRIKGKKNIFLSLSGGYDSRGIAAILKDIIADDQKVICFSHNFSTNSVGADAGVAAKIAQYLGFEFKLINSYNGDPIKVLKKNAELGQGLAYFCIETDVWDIIGKDFVAKSDSILLVGDMNDGTFTEFHGNTKRALERTSIFEPKILKQNGSLFSGDILKQLISGWQVEYDIILDKATNQNDIVDILDFLYVDQRIPHVNSVARECFQMPFIETTTPYYDNDVLDFVSKLPRNLRDNKKLHCYTLEESYPDLFKINFPNEGWGAEPNWMLEIERFSDFFIADLKQSKSKLDEIISPDRIIEEILSLSKGGRKKLTIKHLLKKIHISIKRHFPDYHKIIELFPGGKELVRKSGGVISPRIPEMLSKILILRYFLQYVNKNK